MRKLAILGANKAHLPLILKAKEMGLETFCFAWLKGADCRNFADHYYDISITDKERIAEVCKRESVDGIISNALEPAVPTVAYVSEQLKLNGISYEAALRSRNKYLMRKTVAQTSTCNQPFFFLYEGALPSRVCYPAIVKPIDGSCSNGVTLVQNDENLLNAIERAKNATGTSKVLIEQFISGCEVSVESISFHGKHHILTVTDKETTGAPYFVETAHHQPSQLSPSILAKIRNETAAILDSLELFNCASHAEFKIDSSGNVYFIEVGARGGGDFISYELVELSTGYDYVKGMIQVALNDFEMPNLTNEWSSGVYFLSKDTYYIKEFMEKSVGKPWVRGYSVENTPLVELKKSQDRTGYIIYQADHKVEAR